MNRVTDYSGLYLIIGPPGTGKTTFLTKQVREIAAKAHAMERTAPVLLCSLTRTAAQELAGRKMPIPSSHIGTLHAHAYRMMERPELAELHLAEWNEANRAYAITGEGAAPDLEGESGGDEPSGGGSSYGDKAYQLYTVSRAQKLERAKWPQALRLFAQKWEEWKRDAGLLDFTDLIEVATASLDCPEGIEVVIADEAQDLSALELDLLRKWGTQAGALMIAGDPYQALYTWRGACPEIFQDAQVPLERRRVLHQSYRVSGEVHRAAVEWVKNLSTFDPTITYDPTPEPGEAALLPAGSWRDPEPIVKLALEELAGTVEGEHGPEGKRVMIAASCAYMLAPTIAKLREAGVPFSNPWRAKRGDWNPLGRTASETSTVSRILRFLLPDHGTHGVKERRGWNYQDLELWTELIKVSGVLKRGVKEGISFMAEAERKEEEQGGKKALPLHESELEELFTLEAFLELRGILREAHAASLYGGGKPITKRFIEWLEPKLKSSKAPAALYPLQVLKAGGVLGGATRLFIGTIHSFKGGEADTVILYPDLSRSAAQEWEESGRRRDNVVRTFYVGITRAKSRLLISPAAGMAIPADWLGLKTL